MKRDEEARTLHGPLSEDERTAARLEAARKTLDSGDLTEPVPGLFPALIEVLQLAKRRNRRDPDDPVIDYALMVADAINGNAS